MSEVHLIDYKGDSWRLVWCNAVSRYLHKGEAFYKAWWLAPERPHELRNYEEVPLPVFTEWWP